AVFRSNRHIYVQLIDDLKGHTLASATSRTLDGAKNGVINLKVAEQVGELIAGKAKDLNIEQVVFDRGGFKFHGKIKALADAARKSGLKF
ncbi:50S ribosomal protein L18, partial [bacterium]|nr:50S ribosomal protein L18 [bacterium]